MLLLVSALGPLCSLGSHTTSPLISHFPPGSAPSITFHVAAKPKVLEAFWGFLALHCALVCDGAESLCVNMHCL